MERDDPVNQRQDAAGHPTGGMWATVRTIDGAQVTVTVTDYDQGGHYFGPVPHTGPSPAPGDRAFLHFDARDRPAYAVIFA